MSDSLVLPAPAKLNLMLRITARREDGYHLLQSVFQFIDISDTISLKTNSSGEVCRVGANADIDEADDLCVRAARLLQSHAGADAGVDIAVDKKIPMGAGLGGGSSDAATVLLGLNRLWGCQLSLSRLAELGLELGADVPVFVHGRAAFAEGVGEKLQPVTLSPLWYLVITPQVHVSTAEIFNAPELTRDCPSLKICDLFDAREEIPESSPALWDNVCTPVVVARYPEVATALDVLASQAPACMTGTGASVFARFESEQAAREVFEQLQPQAHAANWQMHVVRGLDRSPLHQVLGEH